ncbi:N-alpha-acetyltransferase 50 [Nematocida major]|uniref:N-alpha-acetyltransferase 50 n=1 Tax=Nematocida major TaxID=1912982 RepID=UPI002007A998|nr:N-alpha-acetyltransferase 50 [Nematocida major]KAH9385232.1 N-alpha-acetyltransferase 50 [Nematocida major]
MAGLYTEEKAPIVKNAPNPLYIIPGDPDRVEEIKAITQRIFPVSYQNDFYQKLFSKNTFVQLLCRSENNEIIGLFAARISDPHTMDIKNDLQQGGSKCQCQEEDPLLENRILYVILLGVSQEFRGAGHGKMLIREIESIAVAYGIKHVVLHVQTSNLPAIEFYYKLGFKLVKLITNYYKNVYPKDAFLLQKCLYSQ